MCLACWEDKGGQNAYQRLWSPHGFMVKHKHAIKCSQGISFVKNGSYSMLYANQDHLCE